MYQKRNKRATVAKKGMAPCTIIFNSLKVCGTSSDTTKSDTEKAKTASLNASMRNISVLRWRNDSWLSEPNIFCLSISVQISLKFKNGSIERI